MDVEKFENALRQSSMSKNATALYLFSGRQFAKMYGEVKRTNIQAYKAWLLENFSVKTANVRLIAINWYIGHVLKKPSLKWEDIDLDEGVIRVRRTVQINYVYAPDGTGSCKRSVGSPKSRTSRRDVPICEPLRARIERLDRPADGTAYFLTGTQHPTVPRTLRTSVELFLARHGIEKFNFHRLRHTFATRCIEAGVDAKTTSELLGHANVNITLNLYVHPNAGAKRAAVDKMAAAFGGCEDGGIPR